MSRRNQIIRAARFVVSIVRRMQRIAMDTKSTLPEVMNFKFSIHRYTRYVELFPANTMCAISAENALWKHICRFCTPLDIVTDHSTQFMNQPITHLDITGYQWYVCHITNDATPFHWWSMQYCISDIDIFTIFNQCVHYMAIEYQQTKGQKEPTPHDHSTPWWGACIDLEERASN